MPKRYERYENRPRAPTTWTPYGPPPPTYAPPPPPPPQAPNRPPPCSHCGLRDHTAAEHRFEMLAPRDEEDGSVWPAEVESPPSSPIAPNRESSPCWVEDPDEIAPNRPLLQLKAPNRPAPRAEAPNAGPRPFAPNDFAPNDAGGIRLPWGPPYPGHSLYAPNPDRMVPPGAAMAAFGSNWRRPFLSALDAPKPATANEVFAGNVVALAPNKAQRTW